MDCQPQAAGNARSGEWDYFTALEMYFAGAVTLTPPIPSPSIEGVGGARVR